MFMSRATHRNQCFYTLFLLNIQTFLTITPKSKINVTYNHCNIMFSVIYGVNERLRVTEYNINRRCSSASFYIVVCIFLLYLFVTDG